MSEVMERIKARWSKEGVEIRPGVSPETLAAFEARYGVTLPTAVRAYFEAVDGTGDDEAGNGCFRFWPIAEVVPLRKHGWPEAAKTDDWFVFIDQMIESFHLAVRLTADPTNPGPVMALNGMDFHPLAPSFEAFLELYETDEMNLLRFGRPVEPDPVPRDDETS